MVYQRGGIEKLVDELCAKLKEIQDGKFYYLCILVPNVDTFRCLIGETEAPQTPRPNFALVLRDMHNA